MWAGLSFFISILEGTSYEMRSRIGGGNELNVSSRNVPFGPDMNPRNREKSLLTTLPSRIHFRSTSVELLLQPVRHGFSVSRWTNYNFHNPAVTPECGFPSDHLFYHDGMATMNSEGFGKILKSISFKFVRSEDLRELSRGRIRGGVLKPPTGVLKTFGVFDRLGRIHK